MTPKQQILELLEKLKEIVRKDFPDIAHEFDADFLETSIKRGYYDNIEEFKVGAKQVIRAIAKKHKRMDFTRKFLHFTNISVQ